MTIGHAALSMVAFAIMGLLTSGSASGDEPTPNPLVEAARERQARYERVEVTYHIREPWVRDPEIVLESTNSLTLSGRKARIEYRHPLLNREDKKPEHRMFFSAVDGIRTKSWSKSAIEDGKLTGTIEKNPDYT